MEIRKTLLIITLLIRTLLILYLVISFISWNFQWYEIIPKWTVTGRIFAIVILIGIYNVIVKEANIKLNQK